ncbi:MAG: FtsX-like permease family protein [Dehalococcoidia bacterium]|nr:FtsX-like permease family protein [Dehalococcoidia bacterium]
MKLYKVVAKDTIRRRRRAFYTALGVAAGVAAFVAVLTIAHAGEAMIFKELDKYGPNLMVMPAINNVDMQLGGLSLGTLAVGDNYIDEDRLPEIRAITDGAIREELGLDVEGDIAAIAPKLYVNTEVKGTSVMVVGFDPESEWIIKSWWTVADGKYPDNQNEAILGARASEILDVDSGDSILIVGQQVTVSGILSETGSNDDYQIFVPLATVQSAFGKEGLISSVDIRALCSGCPVEVIANSINNNIPGVRAVAVKQIAETEMNLMGNVNRFMLALAGITLVIGSFGVVNTVMSSVYQRLRDIGIMKAVGASRGQIVRMFLYEAIVIGIIGGILGFLLGTILSYLIGPLIFQGLDVSYAPQYLPLALGLAILVSVVASVYPAYRASKIKVSDSFRSL